MGKRRDNNKAKSFEDLIMQYQSGIYMLFIRNIGDIERARELTQEVFLRAFKSLNSFQEKSSTKTWLYQIAINLIKDEKRKRGLFVSPIKETLPGNHMDPEKLLLQKEGLRLLWQLVASLPERRRLVFTLRIAQELSFKEIGEILECNENTARVHYHGAVRQLREKFYISRASALGR